MKTEPTDLDREAAALFDANAGGLRSWLEGIGWCRVANETQAGAVYADAIDTDDPATVGCMLVQVEAAEGEGLPVDVYCLTRGWFGTSCVGGGGPTRGAALVAAMRELKGVTDDST